jgi:hypothetical protein
VKCEVCKRVSDLVGGALKLYWRGGDSGKVRLVGRSGRERWWRSEEAGAVVSC